MVGRPEMRRGSLTLVTRPSTIAPAGTSVWPFTITGCARLARKGSPALLLKLASVVSSRTINAVPEGTAGPPLGAGALVWAATMTAIKIQGINISCLIGTSRELLLTLDQVPGRDKRLTVHREPAEVRGWPHWPEGHSKAGKSGPASCPPSQWVVVLPL